MNFELAEEFRMLQELVEHFVEDHLIPLEPKVLAREAAGEGAHITGEERSALNEQSPRRPPHALSSLPVTGRNRATTPRWGRAPR